MRLNINTDAVVAHTARLERMHRSALPVAVRGALNKTALDVKQNSMPASASREFTNRKPNFFRANSKVDFAKGFDVNRMEAVVGFIPKDQAIDDLEQQEEGGSIGGRGLIALKDARGGGNWNKMVKAGLRVKSLPKITKAGMVRGKNHAEKFTKSAIHAGKGGLVEGDRSTANGGRIVFYIRSIVRKKGKTVIKSVPVYSAKRGRKVSVKATHFMKEASIQSARSMESHYIEEAKKQIARLR